MDSETLINKGPNTKNLDTEVDYSTVHTLGPQSRLFGPKVWTVEQSSLTLKLDISNIAGHLQDAYYRPRGWTQK